MSPLSPAEHRSSQVSSIWQSPRGSSCWSYWCIRLGQILAPPLFPESFSDHQKWQTTALPLDRVGEPTMEEITAGLRGDSSCSHQYGSDHTAIIFKQETLVFQVAISNSLTTLSTCYLYSNIMYSNTILIYWHALFVASLYLVQCTT